MKGELVRGALVGLVVLAGAACQHNAPDSHLGVGSTTTLATEEDRLAERPLDQRPPATQRTPQGHPRAIGGGPPEVDHRLTPSVAKIADALCERQVRCGNVGIGELYPTRPDCVSKMKVARANDLNPLDCTLGVSQSGLSKCLAALRVEDCGNPLQSIARLGPCQSSAVCLK